MEKLCKDCKHAYCDVDEICKDCFESDNFKSYWEPKLSWWIRRILRRGKKHDNK